MNAIIDPQKLFISSDDWLIEKNRDDLLQFLIDALDYICINPNSKLYWNDDFELLLWECPQKHPWQNSDYNVSIVSILYNYFMGSSRKNLIYKIESELSGDKVSVNPQFDCPPEVLDLMHFCIIKKEKIFYICSDEISDEVHFNCSCHDYVEVPIVVNRITDFYEIDSLIEDFWPHKIEDKDKLTELILKVDKIDESNDIINQFVFTDQFMKDILTKQPRKEKLIRRIVKRLQMNVGESGKGNIKNEWISDANEWRFRITQEPTSTRVHYVFGKNKNSIIFTHYYREGEHDDGLR